MRTDNNAINEVEKKRQSKQSHYWIHIMSGAGSLFFVCCIRLLFLWKKRLLCSALRRQHPSHNKALCDRIHWNESERISFFAQFCLSRCKKYVHTHYLDHCDALNRNNRFFQRFLFLISKPSEFRSISALNKCNWIHICNKKYLWKWVYLVTADFLCYATTLFVAWSFIDLLLFVHETLTPLC